MDDHKMDDPARQERLFFTEAEAAAALRVHPSTLGRLVKAGRSPVEPVSAGSRRLYPAAAIEALAHPRGSR
jgi:excisionase family DNA binding protein